MLGDHEFLKVACLNSVLLCQGAGKSPESKIWWESIAALSLQACYQMEANSWQVFVYLDEIMLQRPCHMAGKVKGLLHCKKALLTGDVSELVGEGKLYFDAFLGEKEQTFGTVGSGTWVSFPVLFCLLHVSDRVMLPYTHTAVHAWQICLWWGLMHLQ